MMVCTAIYMYIHDICRYLYPINWQHQALLTYFCQAIHMSCSHKRPFGTGIFLWRRTVPSGVVLMQSLGNRETWWRIAKFTWHIYIYIYIEKWWQCIGILGTVPHPDPSAETQLPESHACFLQKQMRTSGRCDRCIVGVELQLMWQAQSHKHQWRCLLPVFCKVMGDGLWMHMNYKVYFSLQLVFTTSMIYGSFGMSICFPFKYMKTILFIFMHVL